MLDADAPPHPGSDDFAQRLGDMQVDMPHFLIAPRIDLPQGLIKALRIPPGLRVQEEMMHGWFSFVPKSLVA